MEINVKNIERFDYQDSAVKKKSFSIRDSKRKRLFCEYTEGSSDDEPAHVDKKTAAVTQAANSSNEIQKSFQNKEYEKCLKQIDEFLECFPDTLNENKDQSQICLVRAACWAMMDVNKEEAFKLLREILKKEPKNSFAFYVYGLAQYRNGDLDASMVSFGKAVDLNKTNSMKRGLEYKAKAKNFLDTIRDGKFYIRLKFYFCFNRNRSLFQQKLNSETTIVRVPLTL